jgi:DHA2 family lincomycin resistance protein-like MFS transporter
LQQVAGAAGTALFVTLMAAGSARLTADGVGAQAAGAGGARYAFIAGALLSLLPIAGAFVIRKPAVPTP